MKKKLQKLGKMVVQFHQELHQELEDLRNNTSGNGELEELANTAFFMREINTHLEQLGKDVRKLKSLAEMRACLIYSQNDDYDPIRTEYCTATPQVKMAVSLPHHRNNPKEFAELMDWLDVPREHWEGEEPKISLRWNGVIEAITTAANEGKPLPKSVDITKTVPQYSLLMRRKLNITEDVPEEEDVF